MENANVVQSLLKLGNASAKTTAPRAKFMCSKGSADSSVTATDNEDR